MNTTLKLWTQLGLGTALAGGLLAACGGEAGGEAGATGEAGGESAAVAGEGEGGAGGEGEGAVGAGGEGEGGVATADAAKDPVAYGIALAVAEAHVVAARDAYAAGKKDAAAEMFAHPVSEVLLDMDPAFTALGVADVKPLFTAASDAALAGKPVAEVNKAYDAIIAALRAAEAKAPKSDASAAKVSTAVVADMIERASAMYRQLPKNDAYEPYLDGYGFATVAASAFAADSAAIKAGNPAAHARITEALALLKQAYPGAARPAKLPAEPGALSGASAKVMLAAAN
ncbi:hypothetical protein [Porphyrobacter sp. CACIAM 03H1]|uniref:hypothetical protein n=1 Tax=Porphyrobacter sp. CACIAM 03H1 TaxID=2003315 RepID=UPI000B5A9CD0|nr:hypothetical protein [Porphyrobacter sp. CACIAM 03H1]ASJ90511.1 hypothetical protein CBR61_05920 [Porphyrobacter sp. CACIAM 03H1]